MAARERQGDVPAHRKPHQRGALDSERVEQPRDVVRVLVERRARRDVRRASETRQIGDDHPPSGRELLLLLVPHATVEGKRMQENEGARQGRRP